MQHQLSSAARQRMVQLLIITVLIIAGMLFSEVAIAERPRHKNKSNKPKNWNTVHSNSNKTCYLLHKKRTSSPKRSMFASAKRTKYRSMAETDQSTRLLSSN